MAITHKKTGPKLKEGVPKNVATMLRIDRVLYSELSKIAVRENITMTQAINEALRLRIKQWNKEAPKRQKAFVAQAEAERQAKLASAEIIEGKKYIKDRCAKCMEMKLIQYGDSICDECKIST